MTLFNNNCRVLAFVGPVLLASCSYLPDQLNPIDWVDSANDWVTSGIWGDQTSGPDSEARVAGERNRSAPGAEDPFPSLAMVPDERPSRSSVEVRKILAEQLIADRENARYSTEPETVLARDEPVLEVRQASTVSRAIDPRKVVSDDFAIAPPLVPEVPNWTTVEEQFYSMFQASGGAGGVTREGIALTGQQGESATYSVTDHAAVIGDSGGNIDLGESQSAVHAAVIYFGHGSARLSRQDQEVLRQVAAAQQDYGGTVRVVGHASSRTKTNDLLAHKIANHETSVARARAVAKELIKLGIPRQSVFVEALSDAQPDYSEATTLGEAANRRANVYIDFLTPPG